MLLKTLRNREFRVLFSCITISFALVVLILLQLHPSRIYIFSVLSIYVLCIVVVFYHMSIHFKRLRKITLEIEQISRGDFSGFHENQNENDIDILEYQLYQLSKRVDAGIAQADRDKAMVRALLSGLSHQFKTPITVMRTFNDLLLEGAVENREIAQEFLSKSSIQLDKLEKLVSMFLKLSKIETGITLINKKNNNLSNTVEEIVRSLDQKLLRKKLSLVFITNNSIINTFYDADWLFEAIYNILDNAIEYTPVGGQIKITVSSNETHSRIEIWDNGIGIDEKDLPRITEIFYQSERSKKQNPHASGIGLALTKLIIDRHSGILKFDSKPGTGTRVTVLLPNLTNL